MAEISPVEAAAAQTTPVHVNTPEHPAPAAAGGHGETKGNAPKQSRFRLPFRNTTQPTPPTEAKGPVIEARRSDFTRETVAGPGVDSQGRRTEGVAPAETVKFSESVVVGFRGFAEFYVQNLIRMREKPSGFFNADGSSISLYDHMKNNQGASEITYPEDDFMLQLFSETDSSTHELKAKSPDQILAVIKGNPKIMNKLMIVEEKFVRDINAALGRRAELTPGGRTDLAHYNRQVNIDGQGPVRGGLRNLQRFLTTSGNEDRRGGNGIRRDQAIAATANPGAIAGAAIGGLVAGGTSFGLGVVGGAAIGAAAGPTLAMLAERMARGGTVLRFVEDPQARTHSMSNAEIIRAQEFLGIDPRDPENSQVLQARHYDAIKYIYHRAEFMEALGVPPQNLDALSDQFLEREDLLNERNVSVLSGDLDRSYRRLHQEEMNRRVAAAVGGPVAEIGYDDRRQLFRRAQEEVFTQGLESALRNTTAAENHSQRLAEQISLRGENGAILTARREDANNERTRLGNDKTALNGDQTQLDSYAESLRTLNEARDSLASTFAQTVLNGAAAANPRAAEQAIDNAISDPGAGNIQIVLEDGSTRTIQNIAARIQAAQGREEAAQNAAAALPGANKSADEARKTRIARAGENYTRELALIEADKAILVAAKGRITTLQQTITTNEESTLRSQEAQQRTRTLSETLSASTRLNGVVLPAGADMTTALAAINAAHTANPAEGWSANENDENRHLVRQAIISQRVDAAMTGDPAINGFRASFDRITTTAPPNARISPEDLRALSMDQLENRANSLAAAGVPPASATRTAALQQAKAWAEAQVAYTRRELRNEIGMIDAADRVQERLINNVDLSQEVRQLELIKQVYEDTANIEGRAYMAIINNRNSHRLERYESVVPATAAQDGYTQAEATSNLPRNVLDVINILTDYQNKPDRAGEFQKIIRSLGPNPEARLGQLLDQNFEGLLLLDPALPPPGFAGAYPPAPGSLEEFSLRLSWTLANSHAFRERNMTESMRKTIDKFLDWSRTI